MTHEHMTDVLRSARNRISDESRWCTGAYSKDSYGNAISPCSPEAERWCAAGAIVMEMSEHAVLYTMWSRI